MLGDKRQPRDCVFITIRETIKLFEGVKLPSGASNYTLWYKKSDPNVWGLTVKKFDKTSPVFPSQHIWKVTWKNSNGKLIPCTQLDGFTMENIDGDKFLEFETMIKNHLEKK